MIVDERQGLIDEDAKLYRMIRTAVVFLVEDTFSVVADRN